MFLASIVESSDDAIISKKLDGTITSWNDGAVRMYGYSREEAVGQRISMITPPDRRAELKEALESISRGERIEHRDT